MARQKVFAVAVMAGFALAIVLASQSHAQAPCSPEAHKIANVRSDVRWVREPKSAVLMQHPGGEISIQCEFTTVETEVRAVAVHWARDSRQPYNDFVKAAVAFGSTFTGDPLERVAALAQRCLLRARHPEQMGRYQAVSGKTTLPCRNDSAAAMLTFYKRLQSDTEN